MINVLVAYASKHHSTAEIAEEIGKILRQTDGLQVEVREVSTVNDLSPYGAVVLGSAVYTGQWQPEAAEFLKRHEKELAQRPVWLFSSGPTGMGGSTELTHGWKLPEGLRLTAKWINPRDITVFRGNIHPQTFEDAEAFNWVQRLVLKVVHPPIGDFRDWTMIRGWANQIAQNLQSLVSQ